MAKRKKTLKLKRASKGNLKKTAVSAGVVLVLGSSPLYAKPQFLLGLYVNPSLPLSMGNNLLDEESKKSGKVPYGIGGTGKLTYRPYPFIDIFAEGTFNNFVYPFYNGDKTLNNYQITQMNVSGGAGYNLPIGDRFSLNASMKAGVSFIENNPTLAVGASVGFTYRVRPALSVGMNTSAEFNGPQIIPVTASPGITVNINELFNKSTNLYMEMVDQQPVFPVLYSWYENNPFGTVRIANLEDATIKNIKVSFYQPQYMNQPNLCAEMDVLGKEEYFDADLTAFFNERMLELTELTETQATLIVEYSYLGQKRRKEFPITIPVYDRNSMNWADDRRAASFVSSKDPAAMWFSKYVTSIVRDNVRSGVPQNVQYAMGIFETLDQFGINYVIDPNSSYTDNVGGESIDFLQFPYQTLMYRGGDCDDLSILVCSLFEAVGIKTAFITVPGHIYMAYDTGLTEDEAYEKFSDPSQLIFNGGKVWMPLEVTISDEGFMKAWRVGAREWNVADAQGEAAIYPTEESWKIYRPVSVPGAEANFQMPDKRIVAKLFEHRIDEWVKREIEPAVEAYKQMLAREYDQALQNNLGVLYSRYGLFNEAENEFKGLRKAGYIPAVVNTANVYFAKKSFNKALASYKAVLREEPMNELAVLGAARSQWELGNFRECDKYYDQLKAMNPKLADEYTYLGSFVETKGRAYNLADRLDTLSWDVQKSKNSLPDEDELLGQKKFDTDPEAEAELPPLDLNDENRFEVDFIKEPEKRNAQAELDEEEKEEEEARKALALEKSEVEPELPVMLDIPQIAELPSIPKEVETEPEPEAEEESVTEPEVVSVVEPVTEVAVASEAESVTEPEVVPVVEPETEVAVAPELPDFLFADLKTLEPDVLLEETEEETPEEKALAAVEAEIKADSKDAVTEYSDAWTKLTVKTEVQEEAPIVDRSIPRFTESPSAQWAPEEAFTIAAIPGMRSFDEEMGNTQNDKAFLFQEDKLEDDNDENFDVFADTEDTKVLVRTEEIEAVNPFGSFFDDELMEEAISGIVLKTVTEEKQETYEKVKAEVLVKAEKENRSEQPVEIIQPAQPASETKPVEIMQPVAETQPVKTEVYAEAKQVRNENENILTDKQKQTEIVSKTVRNENENILADKQKQTEIINETVRYENNESETVVETRKNKKIGVVGAAAAVILGALGAIGVIRKRKENKPVEGK